MSQKNTNEEREVKKPSDKFRRLRWVIWCGLVVVGVVVAVVSPKYLLLVLVIACLILSSHLPYSVRGMFMAAPFSRNVTKRKKDDSDA